MQSGFRNGSSFSSKRISYLRNRLFIKSLFDKHLEYNHCKKNASLAVFKYLFYLLANNKFFYFISLLCGIIIMIIDFSFNAIFSKQIVDVVQSYEGTKNAIWTVLKFPIFMMMIIWGGGDLIGRLGGWIYASILEPSIDARVKMSYVSRMMKNSYEYFLDNEIGQITGNMYTILNNAKDIIRVSSRHLIPNFFTASFLLFSFFFIHWKLGLIVLFHAILTVVSFIIILPKNFELSKKSVNAYLKTVSFISDIIINISSVILSCKQKYELNSLKNLQNSESRRISTALEYIEKIKIMMSFYHLIICGIIYFYFTVRLFIEGEILLSDIIYSISAIGGYCAIVYFTQMDLLDMSMTFGTLKEALDVMNNGNIAKNITGEELKITNGIIEFNKISFGYGYEKDSEDIFDEETLVIKAKEKVGLVGRSGSGKTTFINLLLRNLDLDDGKILIDKQDISKISEESLKHNISVISQDTILFNRSIFDNIKYSKANATFEEVIQAAKNANAHDFIVDLEDGYRTFAGERGSRLSGGQRQRIIIARAILKNSPILILDEATSALDAESEEIVHKSLMKLMEGKTVIAIAHKLTTLRDMDRIIVLQDGEIIESGTHENLMNNSKSFYSKLWNIQKEAILDL